jgi:hypothetical protein
MAVPGGGADQNGIDWGQQAQEWMQNFQPLVPPAVVNPPVEAWRQKQRQNDWIARQKLAEEKEQQLAKLQDNGIAPWARPFTDLVGRFAFKVSPEDVPELVKIEDLKHEIAVLRNAKLDLEWNPDLNAFVPPGTDETWTPGRRVGWAEQIGTGAAMTLKQAQASPGAVAKEFGNNVGQNALGMGEGAINLVAGLGKLAASLISDPTTIVALPGAVLQGLRSSFITA